MQPAADREPMRTDDNGNPWLAAWHPPDGGPPAGLHAWARIGLRILAEAGV
jgi:hypothetical protein